MAEVASAFVTLIPSAKGFGKGISTQIDGDVQRTGKKAGGRLGSVMGVGAGAAMAKAFAPLAAVTSVAAVGSWLSGAVDAASDLNETANKSSVIFGKNAAAMDKWANGAARAFGLSKAEALNAASSFGDMFSQLGFSGNAAAKMSRDVVKLSADLGSFNNLPTADVNEMIAASFRGEYDSLQRVIPNINAARVEQEALNRTHKKSAKDLTAAEKAAATLAIIQKDGARANGDFARTSNGVANKAKIQAARMQDLKTKVGQVLLPVKSLALDAFGGLITFGEKSLPVLQKAGDFIGGLFSGDAISKSSAFQSAISGISTWLKTSLMPAFDGVMTSVKGFVAVALPIAQQFVSGMQARLAPMLPTVKSIFSTIGSIITGVMGLIAAVISRVTSVISFVWSRWGSNIMDYAGKVWSAVLTIINAALGVVQGIIKTVTAIIRGDWSGAWAAIKATLAKAWEGIKAVIRLGVTIIKGVLSGAWALIKTGASAAWNGVKSLISGAWDGIKSAVSRKASEVVASVKSLPGKAKAALSGIGSSLASAGRSLIDGFIGGIESKFRAVKEKLGSLTKMLPDWKGPRSLDKVLLRDNGRLIMDGFIGGLESRYRDVKGSLGGLTNSLAVQAPSGDAAALRMAGAGKAVDVDQHFYGITDPEEAAAASVNRLTFATRLP